MGLDMYLDRHPADEQVAYWRKVNWLHGYIVREFGGGVDECQDIPMTRENAQQILGEIRKVCGILDGAKLIPQKEAGIKDCQMTYVDDPDGVSVAIEWDGERLKGVDDERYYKVEKALWPILDGILPPTRGFFFGSHEYDVYYVTDIFEGRKEFEQIVDEWDDGYDYVYRASW